MDNGGIYMKHIQRQITCENNTQSAYKSSLPIVAVSKKTIYILKDRNWKKIC